MGGKLKVELEVAKVAKVAVAGQNMTMLEVAKEDEAVIKMVALKEEGGLNHHVVEEHAYRGSFFKGTRKVISAISIKVP